MPGWTWTSFSKAVPAALALPALFVAGEAARGTLGVNPLERLIREPGHWALMLLLAVLSITPLRHAGVRVARGLGHVGHETGLFVPRWGRRLADWNWLVRLRRPLGVASFCYALAHVALYATLDAGLQWREFVGDARDKPFVLAGLAAFVLLIPLAVKIGRASCRERV